jgi:hypothetical protein
MRVKDRPVIEMQQLVFASPLDTHDPALLKQYRFRIRKLAQKRGMQRARRQDCLSLDRLSEAAHRFLYFG